MLSMTSLWLSSEHTDNLSVASSARLLSLHVMFGWPWIGSLDKSCRYTGSFSIMLIYGSPVMRGFVLRYLLNFYHVLVDVGFMSNCMHHGEVDPSSILID